MLGVRECFVVKAGRGGGQGLLAVQPGAGEAPGEAVANAACAGEGTGQVVHPGAGRSVSTHSDRLISALNLDPVQVVPLFLADLSKSIKTILSGKKCQ